MHRRYDRLNIPTELLRTIIAIADLGSFTKAGEVLQLTQSAISAQVKRLQQLVGGELFTKSGSGLRLNQLGESVASYARRILALNDQILALRGSPQGDTVRVGLPNGLTQPVVVEIIRRLTPAACGCNVYFRTDTAENQSRALYAGHIDLAFISDPPDQLPVTLTEWTDQLYWIKAKNFALSPGAPVPLISWPGGLSDRYATAVFQQRSMQYVIAFSSSEIGLRLAAVEAGLGLMVAPLRTKRGGVVFARDHYLPALPTIRAGLYLREGIDVRRCEAIAAQIELTLKRYATEESVSDSPFAAFQGAQRVAS
jgi:DNA-binding transcriptional LysR family regulator